jgi:hypothetical protein
MKSTEMAQGNNQPTRKAEENSSVLALVLGFVSAFLDVDQRVITREEREVGRVARGFWPSSIAARGSARPQIGQQPSSPLSSYFGC